LIIGDQLLPLPLTECSVHVCVDMQRIFSDEGPWPTPWMNRVFPIIASLACRHPERTIFTRFIPPQRPEQMPGMWQRYYTRWRSATRECLDRRLLELMPPLRLSARRRRSSTKCAIPLLSGRDCSRICGSGGLMR
jgi:hypothetical protein